MPFLLEEGSVFEVIDSLRRNLFNRSSAECPPNRNTLLNFMMEEGPKFFYLSVGIYLDDLEALVAPSCYSQIDESSRGIC